MNTAKGFEFERRISERPVAQRKLLREARILGSVIVKRGSKQHRAAQQLAAGDLLRQTERPVDWQYTEYARTEKSVV